MVVGGRVKLARRAVEIIRVLSVLTFILEVS